MTTNDDGESVITNLKNAIVGKVTSLISTHNSDTNSHSDIRNSIPSPSTSNPLADTTSGSVGNSATYAKANHTHPKSDLYDVTVEKQQTAETGFVATYVIKQNNTQVGSKINIPKDFLVKSATMQNCITANSPLNGLNVGDPYLDFVVNTVDDDETDNHIYINVSDLVNDSRYTASTGLTLTNNAFSVNYGTTAGTACAGNDPRLSDTRTPKSHTHNVVDLSNYMPKSTNGSGTAGYIKVLNIKTNQAYLDDPITFEIYQRQGTKPIYCSLKFSGSNNTDPTVSNFESWGSDNEIYIYKASTNNWQVIVKKLDAYESLTVENINCNWGRWSAWATNPSSVFTHLDETITSLPNNTSSNPLIKATYNISNVLTDTDTDRSLSANQGKVLKGLIDGKAPSNDPRLSDSRAPLFTRIPASEENVVDLNSNTYRVGGFYYIESDAKSPYVINCPLSGGSTGGSASNVPYNNNKSFFMLVETWGTQSLNYFKQTLTYYTTNETYTRTHKNGAWAGWTKLSQDGHNHDGTYIKTGTGTVTSTNIADRSVTFDKMQPVVFWGGGSNSAAGYIKMIKFKFTSDAQWRDKPITFDLYNRQRTDNIHVSLKFKNAGNNDPDVDYFSYTSYNTVNLYIYKEETSTWSLIIQKEANGNMEIVNLTIPSFNRDYLTYFNMNTQISALPSNTTANPLIQATQRTYGGTSNNNITAPAFIKSGGTSSQFLKADGSVDDNAYLTHATKTEYIQSTHASSTSTWTGTSSTISSIERGTLIFYRLNQAPTTTNVTLNLTLKSGTTTGAKGVWIGGTRVTNQFPQGSVIMMVYDGSNWIVSNESPTTTTATVTYTDGNTSTINFVTR